MTRIREFFFNLSARIRIAWIKYWALQRRFAFDRSRVSFRRALIVFVSVILILYFVVGMPILGYLVYAKQAEGIPLAIASTLYPFPVATVGNDTILLRPFSDRLAYLKFFSQQTQQSLPPEPQLRQQVIDKLVDEAVVRQWANKAGITVTNADINAAYNKIIKDKGSENDVETVLSQLYNLNAPEFKRLIPDLLYQEKIQSQLLVRVHVAHILVSNVDLANKIRGQVTPQNFADLAKQYSEDKTTRDSGGDLGFFDRPTAEKLSPDLAKVMFGLSPTQISGPVKTQYGYHLVYLIEKTGKEDKTFDQWLTEKRSQTKIRRYLK